MNEKKNYYAESIQEHTPNLKPLLASSKPNSVNKIQKTRKKPFYTINDHQKANSEPSIIDAALFHKLILQSKKTNIRYTPNHIPNKIGKKRIKCVLTYQPKQG